MPGLGWLRPALPLLAFALTSLEADASLAAPSKYLIVSAPREGRISYLRIPPGGFAAGHDALLPQPLISSGLAHPQGLALEQRSRKLLVADPDAKKVLAFALHGAAGTLSAAPAADAMHDVEARWVAVDGGGNIYATDEVQNRILKVSAANFAKGDTTPEVLYDGVQLQSVNAPGGIATDSFSAFWVNKQMGTQVGSLLRAPASMSARDDPRFLRPTSFQELSHNVDKAYGVCAALDNVFYTLPDHSIYGVKKTGGPAGLVTSKLMHPRGCAWDGDGTVYVADRGANAVFAFAGGMPQLGEALVQRAADVEDAFGVAVFSGSRRLRPSSVAVLGSALAALLATATMLLAP